VVPPGTAGTLLVRGGNVCRGYWRAPDQSAESFLADEEGRRWFRTGDLARVDPQSGTFTLLGRESELILCGGFNVYPREVEEVLLDAPGVTEAAVAGAPDAEWGEVPVAFLVTEPSVEPEALAAHCRDRIAAFKVPRRFHRVPSLPRNALGKVQKHLLREPVEAS
jgi:malonyl-CoA/methylmalonyl-CoA synthetase